MDYPLLKVNQNKGNKNKKFTLKYLVESYLEIRIFGTKFVNSNKDKCHLIIYNNDCELKEKYNFKEKGEQAITLVIDEEITNFEEMFCSYKGFFPLIDASSLQDLDTSESINLSSMFCGCNRIADFSFLQNWDVSKCENFEYIFQNCSFTNANFLSNWNTKKAISLRGVFDGCCRLNDIKGIKDWNVTNSKYFSYMFYCCENLIDVNAIQYWNMTNAITIDHMFCYCKKLNNMDSLYKWKLNSKVDKTMVVSYCSNLKNIPSNLKVDDECKVF
jgi:hypothetical protein